MKEGAAGRTVAMYAECLRAFCNWCVERSYLAENPVKKLGNFDTTPQTTRRAMTLAEIQALFQAAPVERQRLYEVALCTGLRANELRNLRIEHLDVERCGLWLEAAWTKNRKAGFQPLPKGVVDRLVEFAASGYVQWKYERFYSREDTRLPPEGRLLYILSNPVKAFDEDLKAAGIAKITREGKLDFHALRVTFATFVVEAGASVKEAQTILRHSNPTLTMNTYAKVRPGRLNEVAERVAENALNGCVLDTPGHSADRAGQHFAPKWPSPHEKGGEVNAASPAIPVRYKNSKMVEAAGIEPV